jgi:hydrogenase-4 component F
VVHAALTASCWRWPPSSSLRGWIALDDLGLIVLSLTSTLYLAATWYAQGYLVQERAQGHADDEEGFLFSNEPESVFLGGLQLFLAAMTFVCCSQHFGLIWVGIEATTLASAPLIYFHRHHRSLEATWKYLLICSVGIALALLGNFLLAVAAHGTRSGASGLVLSELLASARGLQDGWLRGAFLFFLVGYGTKMGLAPMHTWLPDAHSEAPSLVSALLSGALLNCAFLGLLRAHQVLMAAGAGEFSSQLLTTFGLLSMGVAAVFVIRQPDFKRLLAYSSIEHMGILAFAAGMGGAGVSLAAYHACNHSLTKAALFLTAGNILAAYRTKDCSRITGLLRSRPVTGGLWVAGFLAITGAPPFGTFISEMSILRLALVQGQYGQAAVYLACLTIIFIGLCQTVLPMAQGPAPHTFANHEPAWSIVPTSLLLTAALMLGLVVPPALQQAYVRLGEHYTTVAPVLRATQATTWTTSWK